jgi:hypothetical protein
VATTWSRTLLIDRWYCRLGNRVLHGTFVNISSTPYVLHVVDSVHRRTYGSKYILQAHIFPFVRVVWPIDSPVRIKCGRATLAQNTGRATTSAHK